ELHLATVDLDAPHSADLVLRAHLLDPRRERELERGARCDGSMDDEGMARTVGEHVKPDERRAAFDLREGARRVDRARSLRERLREEDVDDAAFEDDLRAALDVAVEILEELVGPALRAVELDRRIVEIPRPRRRRPVGEILNALRSIRDVAPDLEAQVSDRRH